MAITRTRASLVINHGTLSAQHVTAVLGIEPTRSFERGDPIAAGLTREHSGWTLEGPPPDDGDDLEARLLHLVGLVRGNVGALNELSSEGYDMTWWCYISEADGQGGVSLSRATLRELADLPIDVNCDIYATSR